MSTTVVHSARKGFEYSVVDTSSADSDVGNFVAQIVNQATGEVQTKNVPNDNAGRQALADARNVGGNRFVD